MTSKTAIEIKELYLREAVKMIQAYDSFKANNLDTIGKLAPRMRDKTLFHLGHSLSTLRLKTIHDLPGFLGQLRWGSIQQGSVDPLQRSAIRDTPNTPSSDDEEASLNGNDDASSDEKDTSIEKKAITQEALHTGHITTNNRIDKGYQLVCNASKLLFPGSRCYNVTVPHSDRYKMAGNPKSAPARYGKAFEETAIAKFKTQLSEKLMLFEGKKIYKGLNGLLVGEVDGVFELSTAFMNLKGRAVLEVKCPYTISKRGSIEDLQYIERRGNQLILKRDSHYYSQIQAYMLLAKTTWGVFFVWTPRESLLVAIPRDEDRIQQITDHVFKINN